MSYHDLRECTLTVDERRKEADEILVMLIDGMTVDDGDFTIAETRFINSMKSGGYVSVKQLFWLRDIKDKYL
jgi:hypothetical protein